MAPTPFPIPKGGGSGGGRGGSSKGGGGGGGGGGDGGDLDAGQVTALVLGILLGPIALYILYDLTKRTIRVCIRLIERQPRRLPQAERQQGVANRDTSMPAIPLVITPAPAAHLPAEVPTLTTDAIINYWGTPRTSQGGNHGVWTAGDRAYDPETNPYLAARRGSTEDPPKK